MEAQLELIVRLGHLVEIVNRVFESLDLNPLLINLLNNVTSIVDEVIGAVDGLLGSITQGGTTLSFLVDNLGNIVQEVGGVSTIVGSYLNNMTFTGQQQTLSNGNIQKTYSYSPLSALVNIVGFISLTIDKLPCKKDLPKLNCRSLTRQDKSCKQPSQRQQVVHRVRAARLLRQVQVLSIETLFAASGRGNP